MTSSPRGATLQQTHVVGSLATVSTAPAWDNLLRDDVVANLKLVVLGSAGAQRDDFADELVSRGDGRLAVTHSVGITCRRP